MDPEQIRALTALILLGVNAETDVRRKEIVLYPTLAAAGAGVIVSVLREGTLTCQACTGLAVSLLPGLGLLILARATGEKIGYGDGILVLALGAWIGFPAVLYVITGAFWTAAFFAGAALLRTGKNRTVPFVPFILTSYVIYLMLFERRAM